jgi:hypothetical protein
MAQARESNPGIEAFAELIAHDMLCGKDHTHPLRKLGVVLLVFPVLPPLLVWVLGISPWFFLPAAAISVVSWWKLRNWIRYQIPRRWTIGEDKTEAVASAEKLDLYLYLGGGALTFFLLLAVPIKILVQLALQLA